MHRAQLSLALASVFLVLCGGAARGASLQQIGTFAEPTDVTSDPGNPDRLFVVERAGRIVEVENGQKRTFADVGFYTTHCGSSCIGERGLLSIALAPDFDSSGRLFIDYAESNEPGDIHVAEMTAGGEEAPASTLRNILTIPHPDYTNDYGGQLQFGPEAQLFVSTGDGGGGNDAGHNAHDLSSGLGKILRLDPRPSGGQPYTVPADNPYVGNAYPRSLIWSFGLRNPFRFSFDRSTGDMLIGDVGEERQEEVDLAPAPARGGGADFGWNCREGLEAALGSDPECGSGALNLTPPIFVYGHADPGDGGAWGCAIIGGYVARDPHIGDLENRYVYGDHCTGSLRSFCVQDPAGTDRSEGLTVGNLTSFGEDSAGRLYAVSGDGPVYRIGSTGSAGCIAAPASSSPTFIGIRARRRRVKRHRRASIVAWVTPCSGRAGRPVTLWRGAAKVVTRPLDRTCAVRFHPRVNHRSRFRAAIGAEGLNQAARSRPLTIRVSRRPRNRP